MSFENKPGTGAFFPNTYKKTDQHPDFKGPFYEKVGDKLVEREIAVWKRRSIKDGREYYSFKVGDKFVPRKSYAEASSQDDGPPPDDTGIPF